MKLPESVKVGPYTYEVRMVDDLCNANDKNEHIQGQITYSSRLIEIRTDNQLPMKTLIHEAIHALEDMYGTELKEKHVRRFSNGIYAFLVDNNLLRNE